MSLMVLGTVTAHGQGYNNYSTPGGNEGNIGTGYDDYSIPGINEGNIGSGYDDYSPPRR